MILAALVLSFNALAICSSPSTHLILWSAAFVCPATLVHGCLLNSLNRLALLIGFIAILEISLLTSVTLAAYSAGVRCPSITCVASVPHPYAYNILCPVAPGELKNVLAGVYTPLFAADSCPPRTKFSFTQVACVVVCVDALVLAKFVAKYDNQNAIHPALTAPSNAFSVWRCLNLFRDLSYPI